MSAQEPQLFKDIKVRAMAGPNILGHWTARVGWDPSIKAWESAELWELLQEAFNLWPWTDVRKRCRCGRKLEVHRGKSASRMWLICCLKCQFGILLAEAEGPFSGRNVQVVSVRLYGVEAALEG